MKYATKYLVALLGISFLFFGGANALGQEWSAEQKEILNMEMTYWKLLQSADLKGYMELWHKNVIAWPHWAPNPVGTEGLEKGTIPWYKFVKFFDLKPLAINIFDGKFAVIYYRVSWDTPDNKRASSGRIGHFWMKQDGKWQIIGGYSGGSTADDK